MDQTARQNSEPQPPLVTGAEHWEEQRKKWTKGFTETPSSGDRDVNGNE